MVPIMSSPTPVIAVLGMVGWGGGSTSAHWPEWTLCSPTLSEESEKASIYLGKSSAVTSSENWVMLQGKGGRKETGWVVRHL